MTGKSEKAFGKRELVLLCVIIIIGIAGVCALRLRPDAENGSVEISVSGEVWKTVPLSENTRIEIPGANNGENTLVIENGKAFMESASCPDGICVNHSPISKERESIICLPNKVIVTIRGGEKGEVDATI